MSEGRILGRQRLAGAPEPEARKPAPTKEASPTAAEPAPWPAVLRQVMRWAREGYEWSEIEDRIPPMLRGETRD